MRYVETAMKSEMLKRHVHIGIHAGTARKLPAPINLSQLDSPFASSGTERFYAGRGLLTEIA
jgi:hypothetical protein